MLRSSTKLCQRFGSAQFGQCGCIVNLVDRPSPSNDARSADRVIDMLVLHYTGMQSPDAALDRLCDPDVDVSAHYFIETSGTIFRLVPEARRAWHAGISAWAGETDINNLSIGIELENPGHEFGYQPYPEAQMVALEELAWDILRRHPIPRRRVLGHSDVAPSRKQDPGELFDWRRLAAKGIGLWAEPAALRTTRSPVELGDKGSSVTAAQSALAAYGYAVATDGHFDDKTRDVVLAFQRHFRPSRVDGCFDAETAAMLEALLELIA